LNKTKVKAKQLGFAILEEKALKEFGGALLTNHPKAKRPINFKKSMHLVMRSSWAKGARSFLKKDAEIYGIIKRQGERFGVKVYRFANGGNHLHLVILAASRNSYIHFIRSVSGLIARLMMNKQRGAASSVSSSGNSKPNSSENLLKNIPTKSFWDRRPYTKIVEWGKHFKGVCRYLDENTLEAIGFPYAPRSIGGPKQRQMYRRNAVYG